MAKFHIKKIWELTVNTFIFGLGCQDNASNSVYRIPFKFLKFLSIIQSVITSSYGMIEDIIEIPKHMMILKICKKVLIEL